MLSRSGISSEFRRSGTRSNTLFSQHHYLPIETVSRGLTTGRVCLSLLVTCVCMSEGSACITWGLIRTLRYALPHVVKNIVLRKSFNRKNPCSSLTAIPHATSGVDVTSATPSSTTGGPALPCLALSWARGEGIETRTVRYIGLDDDTSDSNGVVGGKLDAEGREPGCGKRSRGCLEVGC